MGGWDKEGGRCAAPRFAGSPLKLQYVSGTNVFDPSLLQIVDTGPAYSFG